VSIIFLNLEWTWHQVTHRHLLQKNALWLVVHMEAVRSHFAIAMLGGQDQIVPLKRSAQKTAILQVGAVWVGSVFVEMASMVKLVQNALVPMAAGAMGHAKMAVVNVALVGQAINATFPILRL
jgi:hypothetical protein